MIILQLNYKKYATKTDIYHNNTTIILLQELPSNNLTTIIKLK